MPDNQQAIFDHLDEPAILVEPKIFDRQSRRFPPAGGDEDMNHDECGNHQHQPAERWTSQSLAKQARAVRGKCRQAATPS